MTATPPLPTRQVGRTKLRVPILGLGSAPLHRATDEVAIAINVTAQNLRNLAFPEMCESVFADAGVDIHRLIVEVTESHVLDASGVTQRVIGELAALGISVSVDDFGTGYSSLSYLERFPFDIVKIDRSFVEGLGSTGGGLAITAAVVGVIVNLAAFFAWHTFWPRGTDAAPFTGPFEWLSMLVAVAAFVALWKYKADIMKVIGACAVLGLVLSLIR